MMDCEVLFTSEPIRTPERARASREIGAVVEFHGIVREVEGEGKIAGLSYEAYEPMARREFERIFAELSASQPVQSVLVIHRLGDVPVGEASLLVRVEAKHRGQALAFCGALIDRMKEDVPIWKSPMRGAESPLEQ
jgi:molybdopterin synthase catalytic subunit